MYYGPVAQRIERSPPEAEAGVRFFSGPPKQVVSGIDQCQARLFYTAFSKIYENLQGVPVGFSSFGYVSRDLLNSLDCKLQNVGGVLYFALCFHFWLWGLPD